MKNIKVIQLIDSDGNYAGLYLHTKDVAEDVQAIFDECLRQAEMAAEQWADGDVAEEEQDTVQEALDNYLSQEGIHRYYAEEIYLETVLD